MLYGFQYFRPPFPNKEFWERDIKQIHEMSFNCVKFWAVWNAIEKEKGIFDFTDLDSLIELAEKYKLKVIINLIPEGAPYWTYQDNKEDLYQTANGECVLYGGPANIPTAGWPGRCFDDLEYQKMVCNFIENTALHYSNNKNIFCFDVWNEPHLEPMFDYRDNILCYCKHSKKAFIKFLKEKYTSLEKLEKAWFRNYTSWDQVQPPTRFGTYPDMLDWRFFWLKNIQNWLRIRVKSCRTGAPNKLVQTHVPYSGILGNKITGGLANELGDEFLLAKEVDMFGLSSFPKWLMGIDHYFYHLLHNEMVAQASVGKQYYQVELQGGAGKKGLLGSAVPTKSDIRVWNYNTVLCGGKGTLYWQFGPELSGLESPGFGLFGFNGENTSRSLEASICAKELNNSILDNASRLCEENAIYVSRKVSLFCYAADRLEEKYAKSLCGVYRAAYLNGIPIRYFHEDQISSLLESSIKNLYVPMPLVLDKKEQDILFEFVNQGGNLILEAGAGLYDSNGEIDLNGSTLKKLAHLENKEIQRITEDFPAETKVFSGKLYRQLINFVGNDVEPNYFFGDSEYAVTTTKIGKGKTTWIGSFISLGFEENRDSLTEHFIINSFNQKGYNIIESLQITYYSPEKKGKNAVVIKLLNSKNKLIMVIVNHTKSAAKLIIKLKEKNEAILININPLDGKVKILSEEL